MSSAVGENRFTKIMPKQFTNQLNLIKKDKQIDEQRQSKLSSDDCTLQSDKIITFKSRNNASPKHYQKNSTNHHYDSNDDDDDDDNNDRWQKLPPKQKQIKKISINSVKDNNSQKWEKNHDIIPVVTKPKKKITIQRDESGKAYFEEEIIQPSQSSNSRVVQHQHNDQRIEQEEQLDSLDDSYEHLPKDNQENVHKQSANLNTGRRLCIKKNNAKYNYIQVDNLPRQIDNEFFKDLLKKEKDHIVETYRQGNFGRVKLSSQEAVERTINIMNKRTLYGQQVSAYEIKSEDYERQTTNSANEDRNQISNRIQTKNRK